MQTGAVHRFLEARFVNATKERKYQEGRLPLKAIVIAKQWIREVLGVIVMAGNCTSHCILPYGSTFCHFLIVTSQ